MPVRTKVHDKLKQDYATLRHTHEALLDLHKQTVKDHEAVIEERNQIGKLLLDCLTWMQSVHVTTKQKGGSALIAECASLVERAKVMGYLPRQEEEEEENHAEDDPAIHQASSSES